MTGKANKDKKVLKEVTSDLLREGNSVTIMASGYSMYPTIKPGDTITISPLIPGPQLLVPGIIIALQRESDFIVHRLIHISESDGQTYFLTRGDSSLSSDQPVTIDDIAGIVAKVERRDRQWTPEVQDHIPEWRYWIRNRRVWFVIKIKKVLSLIGMSGR